MEDEIEIDREFFSNCMLEIDGDILYCNERVKDFKIIEYKEDVPRNIFLEWSKN